MQLTKAREIAADILEAGKTRIKFDTEKLEDIQKAITREDIRDLIDKQIITLLPKKGVSRGRARLFAKKRAAGRHRKAGSKKGTAKARSGDKSRWVLKVRSLRRALSRLESDGALPREKHREVYRKIAGNYFRNKKHLKEYVKQIGESK